MIGLEQPQRMMAAIHDHWGQNMQKAQNQHIPKLIHIDWNAKQNRIVSCNTMNKSVCFCEKIKSAAENHPILSSMHATLFIVFFLFSVSQCFVERHLFPKSQGGI